MGLTMRTPISIGFAGEYEDLIAVAYPLGSGYRWYLPGLMRFNAPDSDSPFGNGGVHPYAYCAADPINDIDPTGHMLVGGFGLTYEETMQTLYEMEEREARERAVPRVDAGAPAPSSSEPPANAQGAPRAHPSGRGVSQDPRPSQSGSIGADRAVAAAAPTPPRHVPAMLPRTDPTPGATRGTTFKRLLKTAVPETGWGRRIVRMRAFGIVRALQKRYPGEIRPITQVSGYNESALRDYLGMPRYESIRSMIRKYTSSTSSDAGRAEWREVAPYFGVDVSDV